MINSSRLFPNNKFLLKNQVIVGFGTPYIAQGSRTVELIIACKFTCTNESLNTGGTKMV